MSKYLRFNLIRDTGKTQLYEVVSAHRGTVLGRISWYGPWRQYIFEPELDTIWNKECLQDLVGELDRLMEARRLGRMSSA